MDKKITKGLMIGLGAVSLTAKKLEKAVNSLVKTELLGKKEAKILVGKVVSEAKKANVKLSKVLTAEIKKQVTKAKPLVKNYGVKARKEGRKVARSLARKTQSIAKKLEKSLK